MKAVGQFSAKESVITQDSVTEFMMTFELDEIIEGLGTLPEKTQLTITNFWARVVMSMSFVFPLKIHEVTVMPAVFPYKAPKLAVFEKQLHLVTVCVPDPEFAKQL
jgi:hypothetical protein